jgi:flagellar biosynthetic protein FliQ
VGVDEALDLGREAFLLAFTIAAPILVIGLMVGLVIALVQAVTQLHEQTLTFVPKILAMAGAAAFFIPWIATRMLEYAVQMFSQTSL